jgi:purine-nucleoside phosphorylase
MTSLYDAVQAAAGAIAHELPDAPTVGLVLGSGLGPLADRVVHRRVVIEYDRVPGFETPGALGHAGRVVFGDLAGVPVLVYQGRFHYYEGHDPAIVTLPMRVAAALGVKTMLLTAATGGIAGGLLPGDLCCVTDHMNLMGTNPLRGPHDARLGERFPDMTRVYSPRLRAAAVRAAASLGIPLKPAVYAALSGPSYETPAEIRMLRTLGADVVGMSMAPEAIVARAAGMEVLGFAMVTNVAAGLGEDPATEITHSEVLDVAETAGAKLGDLIMRILEESCLPK